ncbi:DMT family transporter [Ramlibacter rhizophilus]|uniref:DMT family transporter n=1 Tax=Ramlibacter rhizophilus TaxID=1781167 RepID=A0A4Z0BIA6_9BURK|nr:DMT family transporter [Ramlibacter rhizophilus]TFY97997.1 DMT family transporter [Ramlibacter rhizophilus]
MVDRLAGTAPATAAWAPVLALVFNAFVWGVSWWPFRHLHAMGLHPLWATAGVYLFSLACLLLVRPAALRHAVRHPSLCWLAIAAGLTNIGFNWAVTVGDVVRVVLLFYLMPAWAVLLAWVLLGERPTAVALLRLLLALLGVAVVLDSGQAGLPLPRSLPDWLALMGGFTFALTNILLRRLQAAPAESRVLAMFGGGTLMAVAAAWLGMQLGVAEAPVAPPAAFAYALGLAVAFLLGNVALQFGAARLAAHTTALVMLSEVVFASASSVWLGAAETSLRTWVGAALIVLAAAWSAWPTRRALRELPST